MIKLKTQLTATVSQKDIEAIIQEMINKQLGAGTVITDTVFNWGDNSVTVTGTQKDLSKEDISKIVITTQEVDETDKKVKATSEVPFDTIEAIVNQPTATLKAEQHKLPFEPIVKEGIFKQVDAAKSELGISNTPSFPSVTSKFQVQ